MAKVNIVSRKEFVAHGTLYLKGETRETNFYKLKNLTTEDIPMWSEEKKNYEEVHLLVPDPSVKVKEIKDIITRHASLDLNQFRIYDEDKSPKKTTSQFQEMYNYAFKKLQDLIPEYEPCTLLIVPEEMMNFNMSNGFDRPDFIFYRSDFSMRANLFDERIFIPGTLI